jgi:hypothetical protein
LADSFQPRFIDLVRNYTSTEGTGNFVLGSEVFGYRSFAAEIQPGESFYYSAIGVDKPVETEVGRGTMLGDGTIARAPIGGSPTNFSSGSKTIALVAAAEWFEAMQSGTSACAGSRSALASLADRSKPVLLFERDREGLFIYDPSDLSAEVASDPAQALFIAPESDAAGASGAWVRRYSGAVEIGWFGAAGDGITDDSAAFQAALTRIENSGGGEIKLSARTYVVSGTLLSFGSNLTIDARGATIQSADELATPMLFIGGDRTRVCGGTWKLTGGFDGVRPFDIEGRDCELDGAFLVKEPEAGGYHAYIRPSADGFTMVNCRTEGSNGFQLEASNSAFLRNRFKARPAGGDDAIAIKAADKVTQNIRILGNSFENHAYFCSIGSQIGAYAADDPTYSNGVFNVVIEGNTGTACTGILYIKPGAISGAPGTGYDYRDGTVRQVVCSNNGLRDESGAKFCRSIALTPSRGGRIIDVKGSGNIVEARTNGSSGNLIGALDCFIIRNSTDGSAPAVIEDVDVEITYRDPFDGAPNDATAPGYPVEHFANFELADTSYGSMRNISLDVSGNGCTFSGIFVGNNLDDSVTIRRARLTNANVSASSIYGGIQTRSRILVGPDVTIHVAGGYPYTLVAGTSADVRCPELERESLMPTVQAGNSDTQFPHSAPRRCQLIEMLEMVTADIPASDSIYTNIQFRNKGGSGAIFHGVYTKLTPTGDPSVLTTGFTTGLWASVFRVKDITNATKMAETLFGEGAVLLHQKYAPNEAGGGRTLTNPRLKVRWAPY